MFSALDPAAESAHAIATLWWVMLAGALLIWVGVVAAWAWAVRPTETPRHQRPGRWLFWGAVILPAVVLVPLVAYGFSVGERIVRAHLGASEVVKVRVIGRKWHWLFEYPQWQPGVQYRDLRLPAGVAVRLEITSDDVIHSVWIPRLGGKLDAIPGRTNVMHLSPLEEGEFGGACAEFCGRLHAMMRFSVVVEPAAVFHARMAAGEQPSLPWPGVNAPGEEARDGPLPPGLMPAGAAPEPQ